MTDLRQAAQQLLDWLYENDIVHPSKVSQDLRTALEQQAEPVALEHVTDGSKCWCDPELDYKDPDTGVEVWVHRSKQ